LLDAQRGGCFSLAPVFQNSRPKQIFCPIQNILLTRFLSPEGVAEVSDYMPVLWSPAAQIVNRFAIDSKRKVRRGEMRFQMICDPKFDLRARNAPRGGSFLPERFVLSRKAATMGRPGAAQGANALQVKEDGKIVADFVLRAAKSLFYFWTVTKDSPHGIDHADSVLKTAPSADLAIGCRAGNLVTVQNKKKTLSPALRTKSATIFPSSLTCRAVCA